MIIKSMSRKVPSFGQLIGYIDRDDEAQDYTLRHNLMGRDQERIQTEFEANGGLLQKRKNGVYLYHEIISITRAEGLSEAEQKDRLYDIVQTYIDARCPENMVYGGLHADKDHSYHMHLMISANRAGDAKRLRLTKAQFREIQIQTERYVLEKYPELEQKVAIEKQSDRGRKKAEAELERRTGKRPKREEVLERVASAFDQSIDKQSLLDALGRENLELYVRGKNLGVIDHESGKRHRLKTLDLDMADRIAIRMEGAEPDAQPDPEPEIEETRQKTEATDRPRADGPDREDPEQDAKVEEGRSEDRSMDPAGEKEKTRDEVERDAELEPNAREQQKRNRRSRRRRGEKDPDRETEKESRKRRSKRSERDRDDGRKSAAETRQKREADKDHYVKYGSNADLKRDPSKRYKPNGKDQPKEKLKEQRKGPEPDRNVGAYDRARDANAENSKGNPFMSFGKKVAKVLTQTTEAAMHELEEAGKIVRQGLTGQDEDIGQSKAEKADANNREFGKHQPDPHADAKARKADLIKDRVQDRPGAGEKEKGGGRDAEEPKAAAPDPRDAWRQEMQERRSAGRDDDGRGRE